MSVCRIYSNLHSTDCCKNNSCCAIIVIHTESPVKEEYTGAFDRGECSMRVLRERAGGIIICIFELVVGVLLFVNPVGFTSGIIMVAGAVLMVLGLVEIVKYFRTNAQEASCGQMLVKGLLSVLVGAFCAFRAEWFITTFPVLTVLYGVAILVTGIGKIQLTVDMLRLKRKKWGWAAVNAGISLICAFVILRMPFASTNVLWIFTGAVLAVEGVMDLVTFLADEREKGEATS